MDAAIDAFIEKTKGTQIDDSSWKDLPLFMDELPENPTTDPRTALLMEFMIDEEGDPIGAATQYKDRGNEYLEQVTKGTDEVAKKERKDEQGNRTVVLSKDPLTDAYTMYTKAIEVNPPDNKLMGVLYSNRAYASLLKGNNGRAYNDARKSIEYDSQNIKSYYRGAQALYNTGKAKESLILCDMGIKIQAKNKSLLKLREEAQALYDAQQKRLKEKYKKELEEKTLHRQISKNNIRYLWDEWLFDSMQQYNRNVYFDKETKQVHFSVLLLYDEHNQTDFIEDWAEETTIRDILDMVFDPQSEPPSWDKDRQYRTQKLSVYIDDAESVEKDQDGGLRIRIYHRCDLDCTLKKVLSDKSVKVFGMPALHVIRKNSAFEKEKFQSGGGAVYGVIKP